MTGPVIRGARAARPYLDCFSGSPALGIPLAKPRFASQNPMIVIVPWLTCVASTPRIQRSS
ncbi:MAG: hypothetical protein RLZZ412_1805 [Verrucomicrobiota bacterium]